MPLLFLQLLIIIGACRLVGWMVRRGLGQPQVIGEMIAGVLLGPSLLGWIAPDLQQFLFPPASKPILFAVAQLGIALYMFLVGLEFRADEFRAHARGAVAISLSGIVLPFAVACVAAPWLLATPGLFAKNVVPWHATLFLGAAIAITAFPVLARIIQDRGLAGTTIATVALSAAAIGDGVAWCVVAVVLAAMHANSGIASLAIVGGIALVGVLLLLGPKLTAPLGRLAERERAAGQGLSPAVLAMGLMACVCAAYVSEVIGLHAVFGAFLMGAAMPRGAFAERMRALLEPFTLVFLLPVFFAYSGLNTQLAMVDTPRMLGIAAVLLAACVFAKVAACWAAARLSGFDNRSALGIGALMNARGLTELVILNIGLQVGIIAAPLFSMLVLMAIVTTLMASPMYEWVRGRGAGGESIDRRNRSLR